MFCSFNFRSIVPELSGIGLDKGFESYDYPSDKLSFTF